MIRYLRGINNLKNSLITKDAESVDKSRDSQLDCIRAVQVVFLSRLNPDSDLRKLINRLDPRKIFEMNLECLSGNLIENRRPICGAASFMPLKNGYWMKKGLKLDDVINIIFERLDKEVEIRMQEF